MVIILLCAEARLFIALLSKDTLRTRLKRVSLRIALDPIRNARYLECTCCTKIINIARWDATMISTSVAIWRMNGAAFRVMPDMQTCRM